MRNTIHAIADVRKRAERMPHENGWLERHDQAALTHPLARMLDYAERYANQYQARYDSKIGEDGVLGDYFKEILSGIRGLLNGETGGLDCGTMDAAILNLASDVGLDI
jgi:hypothetical protein